MSANHIHNFQVFHTTEQNAYIFGKFYFNLFIFIIKSTKNLVINAHVFALKTNTNKLVDFDKFKAKTCLYNRNLNF